MDATTGDVDPSPGWNDSSSAENDDTADVIDTADVEQLLPSAPRDVEPLTVSSRFITLRWKEPADANGDIIGYSVLYRQEGSERYWNVTEPLQSALVPHWTC